MAELVRKSIRDNIYRQHGVCFTARAVLNEDIYYNEKLSKIISIYGEHFSTSFEDKVDEFTQMFYADHFVVDGKVDEQMYNKLYKCIITSSVQKQNNLFLTLEINIYLINKPLGKN